MIPYPDPLPAPWGFFNFLLIITFFLHLIAANAVLGAGIILLFKELCKKKEPAKEEMGRELANKLPMGIAFAVNLGVAPLLFLQVLYGQFIYVSSVLMAVYWISIFVLIILAYYGAYLYKFKYDGPGVTRILPIGIAVILLFIVGFLFTNNLVLMIDPKAWPAYFQQPKGLIIHLAERTLIPRYLHFVISSVAIGGLVVGIFGRLRVRRGDPGGNSFVSKGLVLFGCLTIAQYAVGSWYLGTIPNPVLSRLVFEDSVAFPFFIISISAGLASIVYSFSRKLWHTITSAMVTVFFMVLFRFAVRAEYLESYLNSSKPQVVTQLGPALMFIITLIVGLFIVGYLVKLTLASGKESRT